MATATATRPATRPFDDLDQLDLESRKKARREKKDDLENHTVESYLTLKRDQLVAEMDGLTGKLVSDMHEARRAASRLFFFFLIAEGGRGTLVVGVRQGEGGAAGRVHERRGEHGPVDRGPGGDERAARGYHVHADGRVDGVLHRPVVGEEVPREGDQPPQGQRGLDDARQDRAPARRRRPRRRREHQRHHARRRGGRGGQTVRAAASAFASRRRPATTPLARRYPLKVGSVVVFGASVFAVESVRNLSL